MCASEPPRVSVPRAAWLALAVLLALGWTLGAGAAGRDEEHEKLAEMYTVAGRMADPASDNHNPAMAAYFYFRAAAGGHAPSLAALWELARGGEPHARFRLGILLQAGKGLPRDLSAAAGWWRMAAEQGLGEAQLGLAGLYRDGLGVPADPVQAYLWFSLAEAQGEAGAKEGREELTRGLSAAQIADGERLAREWRATRTSD